MALSKQSIQKLKAVKAAILANPKFYNQNSFVASVQPCGTTCCIAGWADFIVNGKDVHNERAGRLQGFGNGGEWIDVTAAALEITWSQADRLTDPTEFWPAELQDLYHSGKRSVAAGKRIDLFVKSGGTK